MHPTTSQAFIRFTSDEETEVKWLVQSQATIRINLVYGPC